MTQEVNKQDLDMDITHMQVLKDWLGDSLTQKAFKKSVDIAIECMKEVEQYRALGTVEELKEAREKQVAKKPTDIDEDTNTFTCPSCGHTLIALDDMTIHQHCLICGQAIDWEEGGTSD